MSKRLTSLVCAAAIAALVALPGPAAASTSSYATPTASSGCPSAACTTVLQAVAAAVRINNVPSNLTPALQNAGSDLIQPGGGTCKSLATPISNESPCVYGSSAAPERVVLFGDSHGEQWSQAFASAAQKHGYQFGLVYRDACYVTMTDASLPKHGELGNSPTGAQCQQWVNAAIAWINQFHPQVVIVAEGDKGGSSVQGTFSKGLVELFKKLQAPGRRLVMLGDIPKLQQDGPICLAAHLSSATICSTSLSAAVASYEVKTLESVAKQGGGTYVNVIPWLCTSTKCPAVIGNYEVYLDQTHLTSTYADYLTPLLMQTTGL